MRVDCEIRLPDRVHVRDVARLVGIVAGLRKEKGAIVRHTPEDFAKLVQEHVAVDLGFWVCRVPDVRFQVIDETPQMLAIRCAAHHTRKDLSNRRTTTSKAAVSPSRVRRIASSR